MKYAFFFHLSCGKTSKNNAAAEIKIDLELDVCVYAFQNYNKPRWNINRTDGNGSNRNLMEKYLDF